MLEDHDFDEALEKHMPSFIDALKRANVGGTMTEGGLTNQTIHTIPTMPRSMAYSGNRRLEREKTFHNRVNQCGSWSTLFPLDMFCTIT